MSHWATQNRIPLGCWLREATRSGGEGHADSVLRPEYDHRASFDCLPRNQLEVIATEHVAQDHEDLEHRVVATDAASRPAAERKIGEGLAELLIRLEETIWIE